MGMKSLNKAKLGLVAESVVPTLGSGADNLEFKVSQGYLEKTYGNKTRKEDEKSNCSLVK